MDIRKAVIKDIKFIHHILNHYGGLGFLLPRSLSELYDHMRDYWVAESKGDETVLCGVCGLGVSWEDLAEIKSLAVLDDYQGRGLGSRLVETALEDARNLEIKRVFTLTYSPKYFKRFGFKEVEKAVLPHKVWADCLKCPKFPECDERAMILDLF